MLAPEASGTLGVAADSSVALGEEVSAQARFAPLVAEAPAAASASLLVAAKKRAVIVPSKPTVVARPRPAVRPVAPTGPWKQARASWYGPGFYGRRTASGVRLTRTSMNVAHKSLKFGTRILFSYKGRSVVAVVNDRGPFIHGRVFDLGPGTAKALRFSGVGTVKYRIL
jgi:rare lipoprotein A (peptidoglycan hydrolase)